MTRLTSRGWRRMVIGALLAALAILLTGCDFDPDNPYLEMYVTPWYASQTVLVPFTAHGGSGYVEYRYEYDAGNGWEVDVARTMRMPDDNRGLIELTLTDPGWGHRISVDLLGQSGPGRALQPVASAERYFHVDPTPPSAESGSLQLSPYEAGSPLPGPPYTYNANLELRILLDHPEFLEPSGSPVDVFFTRDGSVPNEWSEDRRVNKGFIDVWPDAAGGPRTETYRFIVIDRAGNRSGVRTMVISAP